MASKMSNQIDLTPATNPSLGLHVHTPAGHSASEFNNLSDFPNAAPNASAPSGGKAVSTKITGTQGAVVRFSNPS